MGSGSKSVCELFKKKYIYFHIGRKNLERDRRINCDLQWKEMSCKEINKKIYTVSFKVSSKGESGTAKQMTSLHSSVTFRAASVLSCGKQCDREGSRSSLCAFL